MGIHIDEQLNREARGFSEICRISTVEALFGKGHQLTWHNDLSQPGQFACKEQLTITGPKGSIERVRVLGPTRNATQVEIAMTEQFKLGIHPPIRESGDRELIFGDVLIRVNPDYSLAMHIDTDEANAANVKTGAMVFIQGIQNLD